MGRRLLRRTGHTRSGGDGGSCPGGGRSLLLGPWGGLIFGEPGPLAWGGRGVQPRGLSEPPSRPMGRRYRATMLRRSPALEPPGLSPCTAPLLGRGPLTSVMSSLRGPLYPHTWTPTMKTPHWSLLVFAPGLLRSRGRPPMRGPGGAPHGRCQPARGVLAVSEVGGGGKGQRQGGVMGHRRWLGAISGGHSSWQMEKTTPQGRHRDAAPQHRS